MSERFIVIEEDWFALHTIIKTHGPYRGRYYGLVGKPWRAMAGEMADLFESMEKLIPAPSKFQQAPIGYKVKPITIGGRTFYV